MQTAPMRIVLEHVTATSTPEGDMALRIEMLDLPDGIDPVDAGFTLHSNALSHSTSWRAVDDALILTFIHVLSDGSWLESTWVGSPEEP